MNHTPEPWDKSKHATPQYAPQYGIHTEFSDFGIITGVNAEANADRILACVNGCKGIKDPETTIPALVAALRKVLDTIGQVAEDCDLSTELDDNINEALEGYDVLEKIKNHE